MMDMPFQITGKFWEAVPLVLLSVFFPFFVISGLSICKWNVQLFQKCLFYHSMKAYAAMAKVIMG